MDTKKMETVTPKEVGVDPRDVLDFLDRIGERNIHLHSFMMLKEDKVFAQGSYSPCKKDDLHMLFSMSKSFTSTAVGFAVQEGRLKLTDRAVDFFREELAGRKERVSPNMKKVTVRHLLTMNTGQTDPEDGLFEDFQTDWCVSFLTSPVEKEPGSWFLYNTRATYMLSAILEKVTGEKLIDYLKPRLFEPLGFSENIWWERSPQGVCAGGFGLNISVEDLAKFGIFVKNRGFYGGKQLLSPEWFEEATRCWSDTSNGWEGESAYGYGYQFWMCHIPGVYRGDGAFGQYCVIMPKEDMLFATTAGELDMQKILDAFWETVYAKQRADASAQGRRQTENENQRQDAGEAPNERQDAGEAPNEQQDAGGAPNERQDSQGKTDTPSPQESSQEASEQQRLEKRLQALTLPAYYEEKGVRETRMELLENVCGKEYVLEENALHLSALKLMRVTGENDRCLLELQNGGNRDVLTVSAAEWTPGRLHLDAACTELEKAVFRAGLYEKCHVKGCTKGNVLYLDMFFQETSYQDTWEIAFGENEITLTVKRNTGFVPVDVHVKGTAK